MPRETGYEQRVTPQPAAALPRSSPAAFGAEVGQSIEQAGATVHAVNLRAYQIERNLAADREATDAAHKAAEMRVAQDQLTLEARGAPDALDPGVHVERVTKAHDEMAAGILANIREDQTRNSMQRQLDAQRASLASSEMVWLEGQRTAKMVGDVGRMTDTGTARLASAPDEATLDRIYPEEVVAGAHNIEGIRLADGETKAKAGAADLAKKSFSYLQRLTDFNPERTLAMLSSPGAEKMGLDGKEIDALRGAAQAEIARRNAHANQTEAGFKSEYKDQLAAAVKRNEAGVPPTPEKLKYLEEGAERIGDESDKATVETLAYEGKLAKAYQVYTPAQLVAERTALAAKPNRNDEENRRLHYLQNKGDQHEAEFRADPVKWAVDYAATKLKPPPITADGAGLLARRDWSHSYSRAFGYVMPFLTKDEALSFRSRADQSDAGKLDVAADLAALGGRDAINAARQVNPGDATLRQLVVIGPADRPLVLQGAKTRRDNPDLIGGTNGDSALLAWRDHNGTALQLFPEDSRIAALEAAKSLYAWDTNNSGEHDYKDNKFEPYIERGLGSAIGEWNGVKVLLPPKYTEDEFNRELRRWTPKGDAVVPWVVGGAGGGRAMTREEFLRTTPVARPDGRYEFHKGGGYVVTGKNGAKYLLSFPAKK